MKRLQVHSPVNSSSFVPRRASPTQEALGMSVSAAGTSCLLFPAPPGFHKFNVTHRSHSQEFFRRTFLPVRVKTD